MLAGPDVAELGGLIKSNAVAGHDPLFLIREEDNDSDQPQEVRLDKAVLTRMTKISQFRIDSAICIRRANRFSCTEISLCLSRGTEYPISGFARKLHSDQPSSTSKSSSVESVKTTERSVTFSAQQIDHFRRLLVLSAGPLEVEVVSNASLAGNPQRKRTARR